MKRANDPRLIAALCPLYGRFCRVRVETIASLLFSTCPPVVFLLFFLRLFRCVDSARNRPRVQRDVDIDSCFVLPRQLTAFSRHSSPSPDWFINFRIPSADSSVYVLIDRISVMKRVLDFESKERMRKMRTGCQLSLVRSHRIYWIELVLEDSLFHTWTATSIRFHLRRASISLSLSLSLAVFFFFTSHTCIDAGTLSSDFPIATGRTNWAIGGNRSGDRRTTSRRSRKRYGKDDDDEDASRHSFLLAFTQQRRRRCSKDGILV